MVNPGDIDVMEGGSPVLYDLEPNAPPAFWCSGFANPGDDCKVQVDVEFTSDDEYECTGDWIGEIVPQVVVGFNGELNVISFNRDPLNSTLC